MAALRSRCGHYIFALWFLSCIFYLSFYIPRLISAAADWMSTILLHMVWPWCEFRMHVSNLLHMARCIHRTQKIRHFGTIAQFVGLYVRNEGMYRQPEKNLLNTNTSSTRPDNMVNFGLLMAEICWRVWGTHTNFNGFRVLAALLHGTLVVGVTASAKHCGVEQRAPPIFGRAAITLSIGPHF